LSDPSGRSVALFVAGDQLLKGAALNDALSAVSVSQAARRV
jgi:aspartate-semialdehyde dehydrogenase